MPQIEGFEVIRQLGAGGMGAVFEAVDKKMNRRVALKVLSPQITEAESVQKRFMREAWIAGKLNHPGLVRVFERGEWKELKYYSMELVEGGSLYDVLRNLKQLGRDENWNFTAGTRQYSEWVISQIIEAARALDFAHRNGVVHRDIKPMNLLLSRDPTTVKVADFGLALEADSLRLTRTGAVMGTVAYMAPEQVRGQTREIDARTDIYALGVTLFELLTLQLPFVAATQELYLSAVMTQVPRRPSRVNRQLSRDLDVVIGKALEKDRRLRYESAATFADDLENILNFRPILARPPSVPTRFGKWVRRKPVHAALVGLLILAVPTVSVLGARGVRQQRALAQVELDNLWERAQLLIRADRVREAFEPLNEIVARDPENLRALKARTLNYLDLAELKNEPGTPEERIAPALVDISRILELQPTAAWAYRVRAFILDELGRSEEAKLDVAKAEQYRTAEVDPAEQEIEGVLALRAGDIAGAVGHFTQAIRRAPGMEDPYYYRAKANEKLGDLPKAISDYQVIAALMPDHYLAFQNLGRLYAATGDLAASSEYLREALRLAPEQHLVYTALSDLATRKGKEKVVKGDVEGAQADFREGQAKARRAIELDPGDAWSYVLLGAALAEENRLSERSDNVLLREAMSAYEEAIRLKEEQGVDPQEQDYLAALNNLCDGLIGLRNLDRALTVCRKLTETYPDDPDVFYNLAGVLALLGKRDEAMAALQKDFELGDRDHAYLAADEWFVSLRPDPDFRALLLRMQQEPLDG